MSLNQQLFIFISQFSGKSDFLDFFIISLAEYTPYFFILVLIFYWLHKKSRFQSNVLYAGYSTLLGLAMNHFITLFYFHNRPFMDGLGNNLVSHIAETSFPSDHTTFILSIAISFLLFKKTRTLGFILLLVSFLGGIARIFIGVHYPFDIIGSAAVACVSACTIFTFKNRFENLNLKIINFYKLIIPWEK